MCGHKFILFSHHQFNTRLRYVHAVPFLGVKFLTMFFPMNICRSMKVFQLLKLTIDCHAGRGDGSRKSHLKLSYQILHEILSSLVPGLLDCHKCPLLCGVMHEAQPSLLSRASQIKYNRNPFGGSVS